MVIRAAAVHTLITNGERKEEEKKKNKRSSMNSLVISESSGPSFVIDTRSRFYGVCTRDRDILKYMQVYT